MGQYMFIRSWPLDMCLWNTDALGGNKVKIWQKSLSYILTSPHTKRHVMSVKCEEPLDELTVPFWLPLLYLHPNFNYLNLFVSGTELRTDGRTDRRTNGRTDRRSDYWVPPADLSGLGHKKMAAEHIFYSISNEMKDLSALSLKILVKLMRKQQQDDEQVLWFTCMVTVNVWMYRFMLWYLHL